MIRDIKKDLSVLNIFKDEEEFIKNMIVSLSPRVREIFLLNTGNEKVFGVVAEFAKHYPNVYVFFEQFAQVNFSDFRNACREKSSIKSEYYIWLDSDEELLCDNQINLFADIVEIERYDGTGKFSNYLKRIFKTSLEGSWEKIIHENFVPKHGFLTDRNDFIKIKHLTSEVHRSLEKKKLYFDLLKQQTKISQNESEKFNYLSLQILMASHDFRDPATAVSIFEDNKNFLLFKKIEHYESPKFKFDMLMHIVISYSRLQIIPDIRIISVLLSISANKSSVFQLIRGLSFNKELKPLILDFYKHKYEFIKEDASEFNNQDYKMESEIIKFKELINYV